VGGSFTAVLYNGSSLWTFPCPSGSPNTYSTPALSLDFASVVVVCSGPSTSVVYLIDTSSGAAVWQQPIDAEVLASPIIDDDQQQVFIATLSGTIEALVLATGGSNWLEPATTSNDPIQGSPCFDGLYLYAFTLSGNAFAFYPTTGKQLWNATVTKGAPGFSSSCAVVQASDGTPGQFVAAGALDFHLYVIETASGATYCSFATDNVITQGVATMNATFLVPSTDGSLSSVYPFPVLCQGAFQVTGLANPSRPAFDGNLNAIVGTASGLVSLNAKWATSSRDIYALTVTGDAFNAPSIGPNGNVFVSTVQNNMVAVGVTASFIQTHTRVAAMLATANLADPTALASLQFLCQSIPQLLEAPYVSANNVNITIAINETCAMYALVLAGNDPYGASPNYVYFQDTTLFVNLLQNDLRQNLIDINSQVANFTNSEASVESQLQAMYVALDNYMEQRQVMVQASQQTFALLKSIESSIITMEVRIELLAALSNDLITSFIQSWLSMSEAFLQAAINDDKDALAEVQAAIGEFGAAVHALLNPFRWHTIKGDIEAGMADLKKAIEYIVASAFWAAEAAELFVEWTELLQVDLFFNEMLQLDLELIQGNLSFTQALPAVEKIELSDVSSWLNYAVSEMKKGPGGAALASVLDEFVANSEALYNNDLAFFVVYQQYSSQQAQILGMDAQILSVQNAIAELTTPLAGVGAALEAVVTQQYFTQIQVIQTARQACEQYKFWTLSACNSAVAMPAYPTPEDIDSFVTQFQQMVVAHNTTVDGLMWAQLVFNKVCCHSNVFLCSFGVDALAITLSMMLVRFSCLSDQQPRGVLKCDPRHFQPPGLSSCQLLLLQCPHDRLPGLLPSPGRRDSHSHERPVQPLRSQCLHG
jgi:outer membrane protein assembly factor BamB